PALLDALAERGGAGTRVLGWPSREIDVELELRETWGVRTAEVAAAPGVRRSPARRGVAPAGTGPSAAAAAEEFEDLVALLLEAATHETRIRRLARALARTTRQVNTLEQRVAPALEGQAASIRRTLEEREREDHLRLRRLGRGRSRPGVSPGRTGSPHEGRRELPDSRGTSACE
ncbi:MAG TPA: V-type ATP synthase subunit D, partial [Gemmatimonadota bacterium]|nr:V-type ATP synthase subunit D [Gemmatimonadota bacterium]